MRVIVTVIILVFIGLATSCETNKNNTEIADKLEHTGFKTQLKYAKNLEIKHDGSMVWAKVIKPFKGAANSRQYLFVPKGDNLPEDTKGATIIRTPVERLVCTSTTDLPAIEMLGATENLIGFPSTQYISSSKLRQRVADGKIKDLGRDSNINLELLLELDPEIVLTYTVAGLSSNYDQIIQSGIPVIIAAAYMEEEPLGRAEWMKFTALLIGKEKEADSIFNRVQKSYEQVLSSVKSISKSPTVFTSTVYKDVWYMPGGDSWAGRYFNAANANYLWKDSPETGSMELSFESVYDQAYEAEFWIGTDSYSSLSALLKADQRYQNFEAFKTGKVYSYNKRTTEAGGNDYFETGISRPDLILKDIVKILHPNLLPDHELYFYEKLME